MKNPVKFFSSHKILTIALAAAIILGAYFTYNSLNKKGATLSYVVTTAQTGTLITSVSGTGQVSSSNQVDIKPKVSGDITYLSAFAGQKVPAGTLIARIDTSDAQKSVRDAQSALDSANLSLQKLQQPADDLSVLQAEDAVTAAQQSKTNAIDSLSKAYDDGFNSVSNTFLDLPGIMSGMNDIIYGHTITTNQSNADYYADNVKNYNDAVLRYRDDAFAKYLAARTAYDKNFDDYKNLNRSSSTESIEALISESYDTVKLVAEAVKSSNNLIQFYKDELVERSIKYNSTADTQLASLNTYTSKTNSELSDLMNIKQTIQDSKNAATNADRTILEKQKALENLKAGADPLDIASQELAIGQKKIALSDAQSELAKYSIYTPFAGTIAAVDAKKGDSASSGTAIATLISDSRIAEITLNEVDVAKVKVGQKATLTFDALSDLSIAGSVAEVDSIGTASQGVVSYTIKINFDTQSDLVKPGMSVSASIVTDAIDGLLVPNAAVKASGGSSYVEVPAESVPETELNSNSGVILKGVKQQAVEVGSSNDTYTIITGGLSENAQIISKIVTSALKTTTQSNSLLQLTGGNRTTTRSTTGTTTRSTNTNFGPPN